MFCCFYRENWHYFYELIVFCSHPGFQRIFLKPSMMEEFFVVEGSGVAGSPGVLTPR